MASPTLASRKLVTAPPQRLGGAGRVSVAFLVLLGIGALAGGIALVARPDGSVMHFDVSLLAGSPFPDYLVPGLILGGLFGVGSLIVAALGIRGWPGAPYLAFAIGCAQMIWIVVELAIIREFSFLHPTCFAIGLVIALTAARWGWPTFRSWLSTR